MYQRMIGNPSQFSQNADYGNDDDMVFRHFYFHFG